MNQFQPFSFKNLADFLAYLPEEELVLVEQLRALIFECIPDAKEKLAYNVPFYYRRSRICFIWPAAVPWGKTTKKGVELGFCKGWLLPDAGYLNRGNRKEVYIKTFHSLKEINASIIKKLLDEAAIIDEEEALLRKRSSSNLKP